MARAPAWRRLGRIFHASGQREWMQSHAQMPHAEPIEGSLVRVFFTCRDGRNRSHIAWLAIDLERPDRLVDLCVEPLLAPGEVGTFDDCGVMSSWMVVDAGERRFYVIGWNIKNLVPLHNSIGLSTGPAAGPPVVTRRLAGPVFERNPINPYYVSCPCVLPDGAGWRMWYLAGLAWTEAEGRPASRYTVWHARSPDGMAWTPDAQPTLELEHPGELAIARPCVLRDKDGWRMWNCYRGEGYGYRIGHAESDDGEVWRRRDDHVVLPPGGDGFDANMTCYPFVFDHLGERWMLYCGDDFGRAGLGLARLDSGGAP